MEVGSLIWLLQLLTLTPLSVGLQTKVPVHQWRQGNTQKVQLVWETLLSQGRMELGGEGEWEGRMCDRTSSTWTPATKTYCTWTQQPRARHESQSSCWCLLECAHFASGISILSAPMLRVIAKSCREVNGPNVIFFLLCCPFLATCWGHVVVSTDSEGLPRHISKWFHTYNPFPSILSFLIGRLKLQVLSILPLIELIIFFEYGRKN